MQPNKAELSDTKKSVNIYISQFDVNSVRNFVFLLMRFVWLIFHVRRVAITRGHAKGEANQGPGSGPRCNNEHNFAGSAAGDLNAPSVTRCVVMTVHVTL